MQRTPTPPFTRETALEKVQIAEDAWNARAWEKVVEACSPDCVWRNREDQFQGRAAIEYFLKREWTLELNYQLAKELWAFTDKRISVRFECEWKHAESGQWYRTHGNEQWEFNADGFMTMRDISANDIPISTGTRRITT